MTAPEPTAITHAPVFEPDDSDPRAPAARPLTVAQLTQRIRGQLEGLGRLSVEGEVSGLKHAASGHVYFELKDLDARLSCAVWRSQVASALRQPLREGDKVVAHGKLDVYGPRGSYSLIVSRVESAGVGALLAQLERRKQELKAKGWLDRKRPLPVLPRRIGVVTSRDGAAFQDFLRTRSLRWPLYPVLLAHTPVQGPAAAAEIARAILRADAAGVDVIVVIRGGGSLEDLWGFNELAVAEAIWNSRAPVVSGVGHETDLTLCDLVADLRAHTPTDAAQCVIPDRRALTEALERGAGHLAEALERQLELRRERLERAAGSRVLRDARWILDDRRARLAQLARAAEQAARGAGERAAARLADARRRLERRSPAQQLAARVARLEVARSRLPRAVARRAETAAQALAHLAAQLEALSPLGVLARGYSITFVKGAAAPLSSCAGLAPGAELETRLADGRARSRVTEVEPGKTPVQVPGGR